MLAPKNMVIGTGFLVLLLVAINYGACTVLFTDLSCDSFANDAWLLAIPKGLVNPRADQTG